MKKLIFLIAVFTFVVSHAQKNFIDQPYLETYAKEDTLITPDRIFLGITISEKDTKNNKSVEELEILMNEKLKSLGIDAQKQLVLNDVASNFKNYFLKQKDVMKTKSYTLLVYDAKMAGKVISELETIDISNINLQKTEYSRQEEVLMLLKEKAIIKARNKAIIMAKAVNQKIGTTMLISDIEIPITANYDNRLGLLEGRVEGVVVRGISSLKSSNGYYAPIDVEFKKIKFETGISIKFKLE